jgi:hypothetical protein
MPSQRRTLPTTPPDPDPPDSVGPAPAGPASPTSSPPHAVRRRRGYRACTACKHAVPASSLIHGECPDCAGLQPLPLRGEGGRFLPGLTTSSPASTRGGER